MKVGGYAGQVLYIDLTKEEITKEALDLDLARKHVGGFGLNVQVCLGAARSCGRPVFAG